MGDGTYSSMTGRRATVDAPVPHVEKFTVYVVLVEHSIPPYTTDQQQPG